MAPLAQKQDTRLQTGFHGEGWGGVQVRVAFMRAEERSHSKSEMGREDTSGLNKGSETRDKGGGSSEARACSHQQNCNHTV